jgi:tetratricopeptide (TPR) repeat protein
MSTPLLVEYYNALPDRGPAETGAVWAIRLQAGLQKFHREVKSRYSEGTLQHLLESGDVLSRRAAVLALGLIGTMRSNKPMAALLHDGDDGVRQMAADALWSLWFRGDAEEHNKELQRILRFGECKKVLASLTALIKKAPSFAEAYNQRAIIHFRLEDYHKSIADCETVLQLNPWHFGAQAGIGQCFMKLNRPRAALKAFKNALRINPNLDGVEDTVKALEDVLGEEGKR